MSVACRLCGAAAEAAFRATVLGRYVVRYDRCAACGLIQTEEPYWLGEAYADAIAATDTGLVGRNLYNFRRTRPILRRLTARGATVVDLGGGYGLLTRLLRDAGQQALTYDVHCPNLLARGFDAVPGSTRAAALLAFEVLEHLPDPVTFVRDSRARFGGDFLLFSTLPYEGDAIPAVDWWYYAFETGQHVSFYQPRTLAALAGVVGARYWRISRDLHALLFRPLSAADRWLLRADYYTGVYKLWMALRRRPASLTHADHLALRRGRCPP